MKIQALQPDDYASPDITLTRIGWTPESTDLHINLVSLKPGESIAEHVNETLDVLLTCLFGAGELHIDEETVPLVPGTVALIPQGSRRSIVANNNTLRYTTCHRKRGGLLPTIKART